MKTRILLLIWGSFFALPALAQSSHRAELFQVVYATAKENHFQPDRFPPEVLSRSFFYLFLDRLDPEHLILSKSDLVELSPFLEGLHDGLGEGQDDFLEAAIARFEEGLEVAESYLRERPAGIWDLTLEEWMPRNLRDTGWVVDAAALQDRWRQVAKRTYLEELEWESKRMPISPVYEQQQAALQRVEALYLSKIERLRERSIADYESMYLNAFLQSLDPQSGYFSAQEYNTWQDGVALEDYAGLGLYTQEKMNRLLVVWVVPGGPAEKAGVLKGDCLVSLGEGSGPMKALHKINYSLDGDAGLKGPVGSTVQVLVRRSDGREDLIEMIRDKVEVEKTAAFVLSEGEESVGYLRLPRFYYGVHSSSDDFLACLEAFKDVNLDRMILDLRGNRGGSAAEASMIIGQFIAQGPTMLSQYAYHAIHANENIDFDSEIHFRGDLLILVDGRSASGSELVAGTLQDYRKALIVGVPTYGKGSMQRFVHLPSEHDLGSIRITMGQFFTPSGRSPQGRGIQPDIHIPFPFSEHKGERGFSNRLAEHEVGSAGWGPRDVGVSVPLTDELIDSLSKSSRARTLENPFFQLIEARNASLRSGLDTVPLEYKAYQDYAAKEDTMHFSKFSLQETPIPDFEVIPLQDVCDNSEAYVASNMEKLRHDPTLFEGFQIVLDMKE